MYKVAETAELEITCVLLIYTALKNNGHLFCRNGNVVVVVVLFCFLWGVWVFWGIILPLFW